MRSLPFRLLALLLLAGTAPARAATLAAVEVEGNRRTAREVIVRALGVGPGDPFDEAALPRLRQEVLNLRIFRAVRLSTAPAEGDRVILRVAVEERWTLVPIPIAGASAGSFMGGLALLETNLLGRRKELVAVAVLGSRGQTGLLLYRDPAPLGARATLSADLVAENGLRERADGFDRTYAYRDRRLDLSLRAGPRLAPRVALRAGPFVLLRTARSHDAFAPPPRAERALGLDAELEYDGQDYRDWFDAGPALRTHVRAALPAAGSARRFTNLHAQGAWAIAALGDHAASLSAAGYRSDGDPVLDPFLLGGRPGSRGLRQDGLWADRAGTATLDYQVPVWRPRWGTVAALGFVDAGIAELRGDRTRFVAPGAGVRVYVRDVALPALGLDVARSSAGGEVAASFFLGFGS